MRPFPGSGEAQASKSRAAGAPLALLLLATLASPERLAAVDGELDPSFWSDGRVYLSAAYDGDFRVGGLLAAPDGWNVVVATRNRTSDPDAFFWQRIEPVATTGSVD